MIGSASHKNLKVIRHSNAGAALVEFSLLLPMLVGLMAGLGEFSRAIYQFHVADKGVKNAARYLARIPGTQTCPPTSASWTAGQTSAKNMAQRGSLSAGAPYALANWQNAGDITISVSCVDNTAGNYYGQSQIPIVTVSTTFAFDDLGLLGLLQANAFNITASHQEVYIGG